MAEEATNSKGQGVLMPALLITVMAIVGGGAFGVLVLGQLYPNSESGNSAAKHKHVVKKKPASKKGTHGKKKASNGKNASDKVSDAETVISLPTIVTNLDGQSKFWVRLEASIVAKAKTQPIALTTQKRLAQDIIAHMRQSRLAELEGASGLLNLRSDLSEIVRIRTKGRAEELIVHGMIVE